MQYAPRTIAFYCELRHPPQAVDPSRIQKIHNRMFESGEPTYRSFNVQPQAAVLSNPPRQPGSVSQVSFLHEACQFREELTGLTVDEFRARVRAVTEMVAEVLGIQIFTAQVVTIRTLINPRNFKDSRNFLKDGMFGFDEELGELDRQPQLFGLRLVFPPEAQNPNAFTVRVESFANDPRSLFIENQGSFGPAIVANGLEVHGQNIETTYDYLVERVLSFLGRFDVRQEV